MVRRSYTILKEGIDFVVSGEEINKGTRAKKLVKMRDSDKKAIF